MSLPQQTAIDGLVRAPDRSIPCTPAELAHQAAYEAKETARGTPPPVQITYRIATWKESRACGTGSPSGSA